VRQPTIFSPLQDCFAAGTQRTYSAIRALMANDRLSVGFPRADFTFWKRGGVRLQLQSH
jgi:hypothetical protein